MDLDMPPGTDALPALSADAAFAFYERVRPRLPDIRASGRGQLAARLEDVADGYDVFVFDAFGVLNVGDGPIPGAVECVAALRARGKAVFVLTNAASYRAASAVNKFERMGFDFGMPEIVSSRMAAETAMRDVPDVGLWGVMAPSGFSPGELGARAIALHDDEEPYHRVDGFLLLSTADWTMPRQARLEAAFARNPRPVIVANPDVVAPREGGLSTEPGWCGHRLSEISPGLVAFHGKPFPSVYGMIRARCQGVPDDRIAVIGDTLHTDILGGLAEGFGTVLVTDHGLPKTMDVGRSIRDSGIVPDWIVPSI